MPHVVVKLWPGKSEQQKSRLRWRSKKSSRRIGQRRATNRTSKRSGTSSTRSRDIAHLTLNSTALEPMAGRATDVTPADVSGDVREMFLRAERAGLKLRPAGWRSPGRRTPP